MSDNTERNGRYRHLAAFVDRILGGSRPADLPVEQPTRLEWVIHMTTARAPGPTLPGGLLLQATEVIE